jgi:hypothetical protein
MVSFLVLFKLVSYSKSERHVIQARRSVIAGDNALVSSLRRSDHCNFHSFCHIARVRIHVQKDRTMNKTLLIAIAAAAAAVGIWFGVQSRQGPEVIEPVVETTPAPETTETEIEEPEVTEQEPAIEEEAVEEPTTDELMEDVAEDAAETVEEAVEGEVEATTEPVESMVDDIVGDDAETIDESAVEDAVQDAEENLSDEAAAEAADAIEEAIELQDLGLDLSLESIRAQIDAANLNIAERGIIEGLLQSAGENPELLEQVVERLREMTGN